MSYQNVLIKLLDGIVGANIRSKIAESFNYILKAYLDGRINDEQLMSDLIQFSLDVLIAKKPTEDVDMLRGEAEQWADQLYKGIKVMAARYRLSRMYGSGE
jgi:hypothetical protein